MIGYWGYAHQYDVSAGGTEITGPDPKLIRIDDLVFRQGGVI